MLTVASGRSADRSWATAMARKPGGGRWPSRAGRRGLPGGASSPARQGVTDSPRSLRIFANHLSETAQVTDAGWLTCAGGAGSPSWLRSAGRPLGFRHTDGIRVDPEPLRCAQCAYALADCAGADGMFWVSGRWQPADSEDFVALSSSVPTRVSSMHPSRLRRTACDIGDEVHDSLCRSPLWIKVRVVDAKAPSAGATGLQRR